MFKNKREIYQALLDGKSVTNGLVVIRLNEDGNLIDQDGDCVAYGFFDPSEWSIHTPPKKTRQVFEWIVECSYGRRISSYLYTEEEAKETWPSRKLTKLRSFIVEVGE